MFQMLQYYMIWRMLPVTLQFHHQALCYACKSTIERTLEISCCDEEIALSTWDNKHQTITDGALLSSIKVHKFSSKDKGQIGGSEKRTDRETRKVIDIKYLKYLTSQCVEKGQKGGLS